MPQQKSFSFFIFILLFFLFSGNKCLAENITNRIKDFPTELFDNSAFTARQEIAKKLLKNVIIMDSLIPTLKPDDKTWLTTERKEWRELVAKSTRFPDEGYLDAAVNKYESISNSSENFLEEIKDGLANLKESLNCVIGSKNINTEMFCWAKTSALFLQDNSHGIDILIKKNKISPDTKIYDSNINRMYIIYHNFGWGILNFILTPYLAKQAGIDNYSSGSISYGP